MKRNLLYSLALATLFVACDDDDYKDWADPQHNGPETAQNVTFSATSASAINLADVTEESVALFTPSLQAEEGATVTYKVTLDEEEVLDADANGFVLVEELSEAIANLYGKRPTERTMAGVVDAYVDINGQVVKVSANIEVKVTPSAPVISSAYYLVGDMFGEWDAEHMQKFNHSDQDVYEDPVFTLIFTTTADEQYWKIIPQDNVDAENGFWANPGVVGVVMNGDDSMEGSLVNNDAGAGMIAKAGMYSITLNMMDYTYTIKEIVPEYYIVGAMQGWSQTAMTCMLYPQSKMIHSYTTQYQGDANIKLWLGSDFGNWSACFGSITNDDNSVSGSLVNTDAGAMVCPEKGAYYTFTVDFSSMSYTWTKLTDQAPTEYTQISLIGAFNSWGEDADMEEVTPHNWYIAGLEVTAGGIKFRANHDWAISWGGTINLTDQNYGVADGSDNLTIPAGTYNVYFNDITSEFVFKTVK
ncbi:Outer membrane protein SusF domain-containing protein [Odoribacter lunatus]|uniref:Outer membrane protein SusF domain-containing protein n=1 Tax=Odoribacter lunatus TaxID=2941335 RepID=UPI002041BD91|nr:DUF5115 domain-containing protein [Odoribacter lunatus]